MKIAFDHPMVEWQKGLGYKAHSSLTSSQPVTSSSNIKLLLKFHHTYEDAFNDCQVLLPERAPKYVILENLVHRVPDDQCGSKRRKERHVPMHLPGFFSVVVWSRGHLVHVVAPSLKVVYRCRERRRLTAYNSGIPSKQQILQIFGSKFGNRDSNLRNIF